MEINTEITIKKDYDRVILNREEAEKLYDELTKMFEKKVDFAPYQNSQKSSDTFYKIGYYDSFSTISNDYNGHTEQISTTIEI